MTFSSYMEINILIDMFLILLMTAIVLPRSPKLYIALVALNLAQYAIVIPPHPDAQSTERFSRNSQATAPPADVYAEERRLPPPATNPVELIMRTPAAFSAISSAMGGGGDHLSQENARQLAAEAADQLGTTVNSTGEAPRRVSLHWQSLLLDSIRDPHAMWLSLRLFWLAASLVLFIQRPLFGLAAACANLLPVPFLVIAAPYAYRQLNDQERVQAVNTTLSDPATLKEWLVQFSTSHGLSVLLLAIIILGLLALLRRRQRIKEIKIIRRLESYLDPSRYRIQLNRSQDPAFYEFTVDGHRINVNSLWYDLTLARPDPTDPSCWHFRRPATQLIFVPIDNVADAPRARLTPTYTYPRKR